MAGWMKGYRDTAYGHHLSKRGGLGRAGERRAVSRGHDTKGLGRGHHGPVAAPRVIAVTVGYERPGDRSDWIDMKIAGRAVKPGRRLRQNLSC